MKQSNLLKFVSKRPRPLQEENNADVQEPQPSVSSSKELDSSAARDYVNSAISPSPAALHSTSPTRQCTGTYSHVLG